MLVFFLCECAYRNIQECLWMCVAGDGVTGRSSSLQTRPDDEEGNALVLFKERSSAVQQSPIWDIALGCD